MKRLIINQIDAQRIMQRIKTGNDLLTNTSKLVEEISKGKQLPPEKVPSTVVTMHSKVCIKYIETGKEYIMELVYPEEANIKEHKISIFAPTATALLGYQVGDEIEWNLPAGPTKIRIEQILYQPEASGNHLM